MGAGCSNRNAVSVQDSVKPTDVNQLSKEAQQHLKHIQQTNGGQQVDAEKMKGIIKTEKVDDDIKDKDMVVENSNSKHNALWEAVEVNDPK